ncbi:putative type I restriction-modification endonuclease R subunit [Rhodoferax antarcticus ANT.BR]|uniref:Putative type I restriction-modification endonuclease R subunit n=1 Tax=Rhodoferax antarcticus ANT.BR TaxID=1111071 RepID=A0A1Q8YJ01_9BURK|nr:putative type I restriction-modification endonuclease R subunit [Rhodoferax antarcticus ANT.BR]
MRAGAGRVVRGKNAQRDKSTVLRADYALFYKPNIPLAVIEAKDNQHAMGAGACPSPTELWDKYCACKGWTPAVRQVAA